MKWLKGVSELEETLHQSVVTIGNYDGIHLGHQKLIKELLDLSKKYDAPSVVMTFDPHPRKVLTPNKELKRLFPLEDQKRVLDKMGIDYYITEPFSRELSSLPPKRFFIDWLYKPLQLKALVIGYDFTFGANREGSSEFLKKLAKEYGFELSVIPPYKFEGEVVSSSQIRQHISTGDIKKANAFLGRHFYMEGVVETGNKRGKSIGFPTANLYTVAETYPAKGVYACKVFYKNEEFVGVTNVGVNPTFHETNKRPIQVETHILNFDLDIYGEGLRIEFLEYIRPEKKFAGVEDLIRQIKEDVNYVKEHYC